MKILGIDTATSAIGVGISIDGVVAGSFELDGSRRHAETLVPAIERVLLSSRCRYDELDAIAVDVGPGLFTGLRVGVATAKAIALAVGKPLLALSSLAISAHAHASAFPAREGEVVAVIDARRREVYAQVFSYSGGATRPLGDAFVALPADVAAMAAVRAAHGPVEIVGGGVAPYVSLFAQLTTSGVGPPPITSLLSLAAVRQPIDSDDVELLYVRAPDAEINWISRAPVTP